MSHLSPEYKEYMQSDTWNSIRKEALADAGYICQGCGANDKPLDVHHKTYERFFGDERKSDLMVLCRGCHKKEHGDTSFIFDFCQTCGELLLIAIEKLAGGWVRRTCSDGHIREKRHDRNAAS